MKVELSLIALLLIFCLPVSGQKFHEQVDELFGNWIHDEKDQPGVVLAVIENDEITYHKAYGFANLEYGIPLTENSLFDIASLAKQFTGFAIAKLELEGKLKLEDTVPQYFPDLSGVYDSITIKQLIHHSSGLRDIGELFDIGHFGSVLTSGKTLDIMKMQQDLNFSPGSESDYSNTNYVLLASIVEVITNQSFRNWCHENIFAPLGMKNSFANDNPKELFKNRALAYYQDGDQFSFEQNNGMYLIGSSAIFTTSSDLIKWARALMNDASFNTVFQKMKTKGTLDNGSDIGYGYGFGLSEHKNKAMVAHSGATPAGFRTSIAIFPDDKTAMILLSNLGDIDLGQYQMPLFDLIFREENIPELPNDEENSDLQAVSLLDKDLKKFVGDYIFNGERMVQVRLVDSGLTVQPEGAPEMKLIPLSSHKLHFPEFKSVLEFSNENNGGFTEAIITSNGNPEGTLTRAIIFEDDHTNINEYVGLYYSPELDLHWQVNLGEDGLVIRDSKHGVISLQTLSKDLFRSHPEMGLQFVFQRKDDNQISNFILNRGSRMRNVMFTKKK